MPLTTPTCAVALVLTGVFCVPQGYAQIAGYVNLADPLWQKPPAARTTQELKVEMGINAPGGLAEINRRLLKRSITKSPGQLIQLAESASQNIQNGSPSGAVGTTELVSKAIATILGIAEQAGAVSSSSSGSTATVTVNIPQLVAYARDSNSACYLVSDSCNVLGTLARGASASVSMNSAASSTPSSNSLGSSALAAITGIKNPIFSGLTAREEFLARRNRSVALKSFEAALDKVDPKTKTALLGAYVKSAELITSDPAYSGENGALARCVKSLQEPNATGTVLRESIDACIERFVDVAATESGISTAMRTYAQAEQNYDSLRDAALKSVFYQNTFSVEYDLLRQLNQPSQSTFKVIYGHESSSASLQTTANGSASLYNSLEGSSVSRLRSAQAAIQIDYKATRAASTLQASISGGYYFQEMLAKGLLSLPATTFAPGTAIPLPGNAAALLNTAGPIHIGQAKLVLSLKGRSISIPLGITVASRTDLIKASRISGNVGISYDFSSLIASK